jgi:hypothetical protein
MLPYPIYIYTDAHREKEREREIIIHTYIQIYTKQPPKRRKKVTLDSKTEQLFYTSVSLWGLLSVNMCCIHNTEREIYI